MSGIVQLSLQPEVELRGTNFRGPEPDGSKHITLLDLLEIYPDRVAWSPSLDHARLVQHFRRSDMSSHSPEPPRLRIFFIEDLDFLDWNHWCANSKTNLEVDDTAQWMQRQFGVSPLFFDGMTSRQFEGNASFVRRGKDKRNTLDGLYRFNSGISTPLTRVWFSHTMDRHPVSTYMIYQCTTNVKSMILSSAHLDNNSALLRPLAVDAFLAEDGLYEFGEDILAPRNELIKYENRNFSLFSPAQVAKAVESLHSLSQRFNVISGHLSDLHERILFLKNIHRRLRSADLHPTSNRYGAWAFNQAPIQFPQPSVVHDEREGDDNSQEQDDAESVLDSLDYILSKCDTTKRWAVNYNERAGIRINLFFNISTQTDSKINLDIARLTSKIAVSTQKDSSSMITMAAVTMFFLPGTFVSALFSMVFFNTQSDNSLAVSQQIWLFFAVTIPLTIGVFALWLLWQRYRNKVEARSLGLSNRSGDSMFKETDGQASLLLLESSK